MACYAFFEVDGKSGEINDDIAREYDRHYIARCNSPLDAEPEIWAHRRCPKPYDTIASWDNLARCRSCVATHIPKTRWDFKVHAKFSSIQFHQPKDDNPLRDPADIETDTEIVSEERYVDRKGRPCTNTAGDLIKVIVDIPRTTIKVQKNVALKNAWVGKTAGIVNSKSIRIDGDLYLPQTLKVMRARTGRIDYRNDIPFKVAQLEIRVKEEGWASVALNQGYNEIIYDWTKLGKNGLPLKRKVRARQGFYGTDGGTGDPEPNPVFLDKDGFRPRESYTDQNGILYPDPYIFHGKSLRGGTQKLVLDPKDIVLLEFDMLTLFDFNQLPIK